MPVTPAADPPVRDPDAPEDDAPPVDPTDGLQHPADDNPPVDPEDPPTEPDGQTSIEEVVIRVPTAREINFDVGGKAPTQASLTLTGGKIRVEGQFKKGQRIKVEITAVVNKVGFKDDHDTKTGQVVDCSRDQSARIVGPPRLIEVGAAE